ncbi:predicted protein [Nematostella vectensis]|uniref:Uncharacterized protein n=1 Tax=Nematostella vectensis TaxID=45351 RepID=A7RRZ1_NEMVE|nr:predicted protein [Nematostella vectensis]|eukprot:XP_001637722.1 predicted protein [Nematostella vectensis]
MGCIARISLSCRAEPIAKALGYGADIVITGRCVDSALALGPLMHEFGWKPNEYDLLAAGSLAGHLIEENIGYPIAECSSDGRFIICKPPNTGGLVSPSTVAEQLIYEIGDPCMYILPDVVCDFSNVTVQGVCATYADGFRSTAVCPVGGPFASMKARKVGETILKRTRRMFKELGLKDYTRTHIQVLGSEQTYGKHASPGIMNAGPREAVLWLAVHHHQKQALSIFAREIASAGTSMAPGFTTIVGGRPKASPLLRLYSFLYPKDKLKTDIYINGEHVETMTSSAPAEKHGTTVTKEPRTHTAPGRIRMPKGRCTFPLSSLAVTRSGDKGNSVNIGTCYHVTLSSGHATQGQQYELPGINAFNFILEDSLGGGGVASLRSDPQGKALGQMLLDFKIKNVPDILPSVIEPTL